MDKEQQTLKDFLGDLGGNKEELIPNLEGTEEVKPEETKAEDTQPIEDVEKLPFHKIKEDPRFQRFVEKEINKKLKDFKPSSQEQFVKEVQDEDPLIDAFTGIIGNDTPEKVNALKQLKKSMADVQERAAEKAYARFAEESRAAREEEAQAVEELSEGLERIEENFNVDLSSNSTLAKKTRNDFLDFVERISPKNSDGEVTEYADLEQAFQTFQEMHKPEKNTQAKEIASRGMSRSSTDATNTPTKRVTFENVREMMGLDN